MVAILRGTPPVLATIGDGDGDGSGSGSGDGYGYGSGSGDGDGSGYGYGYGSGSGDGYGDGSGYGYGYGYGSGSGSGSGDGSGYGYGYGSGSGDGDGSGYGYGYGSGSGDGDGSGSGDGDGSGYGYGYGSGSGYWCAVAAIADDPSADAIGLWRSDQDGQPANNGTPGEPARVGLVQEIAGPLKICTRKALHATTGPTKWKGARMWVVALHGEIQRDGDKMAALKRTILAEIPQVW